jgi:outer membrane protein
MITPVRFTPAILFLLAGAGVFAQAPATLTLKQAEAIALQTHPRVRAAQFAASAAAEVPAQQRAAYFPLITGEITGVAAPPNTRIGAGALNNPIIYTRASPGILADQLVTDFGRTSNLVAGARYTAAARQQDVRTTSAEILLQVDQAYFDTLRAQGVLQVAKQTVAARQVVSDQVTALAQSKLKSELDVSFANVNLSQAKLLLVSAQNDLDASFARLSAALGYATPQRFQLAEEPMPGPPPTDFAALMQTAIANRPELASLRASETAARRFAQAERDLYYPTVSILAAVGLIPAHAAQLQDKYAAAGVNVSIPIFNGFLFSARRREAEFQASAASEALRDEQLRIARDLRVAWLNQQTAYQQLGLTLQLLKEATQALDLAQARYNIGLSSIVELTQAQLGLTSAQIDNVTARYNYQARTAALAYQTGQLK